MSKLIVVSLIGIPASGKTSLAKKLLNWSIGGEIDPGIVLISFDDNMRINYDCMNDGDYKKSRMKLMEEIQALIESLKCRGNTGEALKVTANLKSKNLVVIDDTMHYRSMRQQIRALCRRVDCNYFQIYLDVSLDVAKVRNAGRISQVPELVLEKLFTIIEKPQNERTIWFDPETSDDGLKTLLKDRIEIPENLEVSVKTKTPQEQSFIHEADLTTRKLLNNKIKSLNSGDNLSLISKTLNQKRKQFIEDLRAMRIYADDVDTLLTMFESCMKLN